MAEHKRVEECFYALIMGVPKSLKIKIIKSSIPTATQYKTKI